MEKINVAQLLKDCPKGMELDCMMFENLEFDRIDEDNGKYYIICRVKTKIGYNVHTFTEHGCYSSNNYAKCVIFPKGKTTWEGFVPPVEFKDGDIVTSILGDIFIYKKITTYGYCSSFVSLDHHNEFIPHYESYLTDTIRLATEEEKQKLFKAIKDKGYEWNAETKTLEEITAEFKDGDVVVAEDNESFQLFLLKRFTWCSGNAYNGECYFGWEFSCDGSGLFEEGIWGFNRLATEEEKQKLFDTIKENGYKWNPETKTLEKLSKFKVGDRIKHKGSDLCCTLGEYSEGISAFRTNIGLSITYKDLEQWELAPNKFDITTLVPFESKVLIRNDETQKWIPAFWGYKADNGNYVTTFGVCNYCIPYEGNENLLSTNNDCDDYYKTWK